MHTGVSAFARTRSVAVTRSLVQRRPDEQFVPVPRPPEPAPARRLAREVAEQPITAPDITGAQQWHQHYNAGRFRQVQAYGR